MIDYTALSLAQVRDGLDDVAREAQATFGALGASQLNWKPDARRWSVAQCFEHLLTANRQMLQSADAAMDGSHGRTIWQRLPILPRILGRALIRSQAPDATRKFVAPSPARPSASDIAADIVQRFVQQQRDAARRVELLDERTAADTVMSSPFVRVVTYSVQDGWRLMLAHDRRHFEQARRVIESSGFPRA